MREPTDGSGNKAAGASTFNGAAEDGIDDAHHFHVTNSIASHRRNQKKTTASKNAGSSKLEEKRVNQGLGASKQHRTGPAVALEVYERTERGAMGEEK